MTTSIKGMSGLGVALVTPFHKDGKIDFPSLQGLVEQLLDGGTHFLVVLGTTGETPTLDAKEQRRVVEFVMEVNAGRVPVVVGVSGNNTQELAERIATWEGKGIAAFLVASPAYNKPSQEGLVQHYQAVADAAPSPVILYNVPGRTASNMEASTTLTLSQHPNICGIKEAGGDLAQISLLLAQRPPGFMVWSGDDALAMPTVAMGADGVISVLGNAMPERMSSMIQQASFGQTQESREMHARLAKLIDLLFDEGNPTGIKVVLHHLGWCGNTVRLPLTEGTKALTDRLYAAIAELDGPSR